MSNINIQQLQAIKAAIKQSIIDKGVTVGDDFTTYANAISQIESGGGSEDKSGALGRYLQYCLDNPETITASDFSSKYASDKDTSITLFVGKHLQLTSSSGSFQNAFAINTYVSYADIKLIGTNRVSCGNLFSKCKYLRGATVDFNNLVTNDTSSNEVTCFSGCSYLRYCTVRNYNNDNMIKFFSGCITLKSVYIDNASDLVRVQIEGMFYNCPELIKIDGLNFDSVISIPGGSNQNTFYTTSNAVSTMFDNPKLRFMRIKNLGKTSSNGDYNFNSAQYQYWGIEDTNEELSKGARQSLIDTLITYSYDRVNAGNTQICYLRLYSTTIALLTETEIAQITAKGFTIAK